MSICSIMNWTGNYIDFVLHGHDYNNIEFNEYDLNEVLLYLVAAIFVTFTIAWWMIPLHVIFNALHMDRIIFKCNKNR